MDGSNAAFLLDTPLFSTRGSQPACGILYIEDFDAEPAGTRAEDSDPATAPGGAVPGFTADDLAAARESGRQEGLAAALADAEFLQAQLQSAATQSLVDGLAAARATLQEIVHGQAADLSHTILAVLQAAVPAAMRRHAAGELQAMLQALAPGMACEPELRVRAHPDMADFVREHLAALLPDAACVLSVCADASLDAGDVRIAWRDGQARRDCAAIWSDIIAALAPLGLPTFKEICNGC